LAIIFSLEEVDGSCLTLRYPVGVSNTVIYGGFRFVFGFGLLVAFGVDLASSSKT